MSRLDLKLSTELAWCDTLSLLTVLFLKINLKLQYMNIRHSNYLYGRKAVLLNFSISMEKYIIILLIRT